MALAALAALLKRRKLNLKAELGTSPSHFSFKRLLKGAFNVSLIGSACTGLPCTRMSRGKRW